MAQIATRMFAGHPLRPAASASKCQAGECYIQERFFDCVSRRFAQKKKRGTLRSE
jgi:hypothetical protein